MAFRDKNHQIKTYGDTKGKAKKTNANTATASVDTLQADAELQQALALHQQASKHIDRILTGVVVVIAFLLCVVVANYNWISTVMTFIMGSLAFYAVGVRKQNILMWVSILSVYVIVDNLLSHPQFNVQRFPIHLGGLLIFLTIIHVTRPFLDKWMIHSLKKQQQKQISS